MNTEEKYLFEELFGKDELYADNILRAFRSWKVVHTKEGGYTENDLKFYLYDDGMLGISETGDSFIGLYPEQVEHLKIILAPNFLGPKGNLGPK